MWPGLSMTVTGCCVLVWPPPLWFQSPLTTPIKGAPWKAESDVLLLLYVRTENPVAWPRSTTEARERRSDGECGDGEEKSGEFG